MSLKPPKKSDLDKNWMKARRDKPKKIQPEYPAWCLWLISCLYLF